MRLILLVLFHAICLQTPGQNKKVKPFQKDDFRLDLKLPWFNHLSLNPDNKFKENRFGFVGLGVGMEYNYAKAKYLETSFSAAATADIPFPAPVLKNNNKTLATFYVCITDNIIKNRFTVGYGINYANNRWAKVILDISNNGLSITSQTEYSNKSLGLALNTYYRLGKTANVGITYRPSLFNIEDNFSFLYEHLITVEFMWRGHLFKIKRN